ncbi:hypothetical protein ACWEIJ_00905 [Lentzea sp. NPDC004789]
MTVHLIDAEALGEALDFVVLIKPGDSGGTYRVEVDPFGRE